ncbi:hypothetical protein [Streptomyces sp. WMMB 322]|uniref:hypothetical protein n=1 Tax=Streptomyces sp. WMMB 322 TaxID=1286821 RepID=UPI0006E40161|nr:hypothetical protein [Streptomyces sp. WMMB 322]SCK45307.1 hypothetical protein H180DRAFT_03993 [Streptomyces sp. WMMB 322]
MYTALIIAAFVLYAAAFSAVMQLGGREARRPGRGRLTTIFGGLAVSGALLMTAGDIAGRPPLGDGLWHTVLNRAPDYIPWMIVITASITCGYLFFGRGSRPRDPDGHVTGPGTSRTPGEDPRSAES